MILSSLGVALGFYVSCDVKVRIHGVNSPEHDAASTAFLKNMIEERPLIIESFHDRRSFERWVCDVWVADQLVADLIIAAGHGVEFMR